MTRTRLTEAEHTARVEAAHENLKTAVETLRTSEGWQAFITSRKGLRTYSANNQLMILMQLPEATDVRPYGTYKNTRPGTWLAVGRHAVKGSHALKIFAPKIVKDRATGEDKLIGWLLVPVFDVSQTEGDPLPEPIRPELLTGDAPANLWDAVEKLIVGQGYTVERGDCGGANGITYWESRSVRVRADVEPAQAVKTLVHELAHILLDHENRDLSRELGEVEAESVACVVADLAGLGTLPYSVPYVAAWSGEPEIMLASAKIVTRTAERIARELGI